MSLSETTQLALAFFSGVLAAIPVRKECEDADGNVIEDENGWLLEGTKAALIECCAAFTIMATGIRQQLKYESKCEAHRVAGRSFKELLLRFENLVQCGIHYLVPGQAGGVSARLESPRDLPSTVRSRSASSSRDAHQAGRTGTTTFYGL